MSKKIKDIEKITNKKGTYSTAKDETSGGGGSSSSFWDSLIKVILPKGGGR